MALWLLIIAVAGWCMLALHYSTLPAPWHLWAVLVFLIVSVATLFLIKPRRRGLLAYAGLVLLVAVYFISIRPSNDRHWQSDVAVLSSAVINGNHVTIRNVRNFDYKTVSDFTERRDDRTYDLDKIREVDFFMSFWGEIPFAHTMVSFGFEDGDYVCFSIETRPEENEGYSVIGGAFKRFELVYVVADERDVIRLRTNHRDERVYLYHIITTPEAKRRFFLRYCSRLNDLYAKPEWYWLVTRNCTTDIPRRDGRNFRRFPESWKVVINAFVDQFLYNEGSLDRSLPLHELRKLGHINTRAQNADQDPEFSKRIRERIPDLVSSGPSRKRGEEYAHGSGRK